MDYLFPDSVLLILCKAPVPGQVKTRLIPALNAQQAAAAHKHLTLMTLERALEQRLCPVILYCAPDCSHPFFQECAKTYPLILRKQSDGDLGAKMLDALSVALSTYRHALLVGCDCPSLAADDLRYGLELLSAEQDVVIAPSEDGGYTLIGMSRVVPELFTDMPWGSEQVMQATRQCAGKLGLRLHELASQWDIDTEEDWLRYVRSRRSEPG